MTTTNHNRMTIKVNGSLFDVFKLKSQQVGGYATDMAAKRFVWFTPSYAKARFTGTYADCMTFIENQGAEFMTEHGVPA